MEKIIMFTTIFIAINIVYSVFKEQKQKKERDERLYKSFIKKKNKVGNQQ